mmetsp:Transcript_28332/g.27276  ORF Transcript_28332/g.27276 Transcript_28332/m.27276 type:complete len:87 (-) Transcript_28332:136-396(-)
MSSLNESLMRINRFQRVNQTLSAYGGNAFRRSLESSERKTRYILGRSHSETRFGKAGHMMPRPVADKIKRSASISPRRQREKETPN